MRAQGVVMLLMLIFLQAFTLLGLLAFMAIGLQLKNNKQQWQMMKLTFKASRQLQQITVTNTLPSCMIAIVPLSDLQKKPLLWWRQYGCYKEGAYYVVEKLGADACGFLYYRVTLTVLTDEGRVMLQRIDSKSLLAQAKCNKMPT